MMELGLKCRRTRRMEVWALQLVYAGYFRVREGGEEGGMDGKKGWMMDGGVNG